MYVSMPLITSWPYYEATSLLTFFFWSVLVPRTVTYFGAHMRPFGVQRYY